MTEEPRTTSMGIRFKPEIFREIEDFANEKFEGNISKTVNAIARDFFLFLKMKRRTAHQIRTEQPKQTKTLGDF